MKYKVNNETFLIFLICFLMSFIPERVNAYCGTCGNTPQTTYDSCGEPVTHNCTYNSPLCRYEDCGPWPLSGGIYRPSKGKTCYYYFKSDACAGSSGEPGGCTPDGTCACESELPTCPYVNSGNDDYTTTKPVDAEGNTIESPLDACIGNSISCTKKDSCDDDCGTDGPYACYLPETNLSTIPTPTWNKLKIGNRLSGNLSTSSLTPTRVPYPLSSTETTESLTNTITNPDGSRGLRYNFTIGGVLTTQTVNTLTNQPTAASLTQGSTGSITTSYSTLNKCNNNLRTGSQLTTYYKVDNLTTIDHTISSSLTISGYTGDDSTGRGCTASPSYTGKITNNPLKVRIVAKDSDGSSDINGVFLWLVKNGSSIPSSYIDKMYTVGGGATSTDPNLIGIFVGLNDIRTVATIYKSNNSGGTLVNWGSDSGSTSVRNSAGNVLIQEIKVLSRTENALDKTYTFELELTFPESSPLAGNYKFHTTATDKLTFYNSNSVELRTLYHNSNWQWNFDFANPIITGYDYDVPVTNQREIDLSWVNDGTGSDIKDTVVNIYIDPDPDPLNTRTELQVKRLIPVGSLLYPIEKPVTDEIGLITPVTSGWYSPDSLQTSNIDIGFNTSGTISFFTTIYDQACNYYITNSDTTREYNLNKWIATKGGIFYSDGLVSFIPKEIDSYNLGTELVTTTVSSNPDVRNISDLMNPVRVRSVKDSNDTNSDTIYSYLLERHQKMIGGGGFTTITSIGECTSEQKCILSASTVGANGVTTTYSGKIMVVSDGNINIYPDIVASNPATDGLIFFSGGNINIVGTHRKSTAASLLADRIEAMMIARNAIIITKEDPNPSIQQDRVEIIGSLLGLGSNNTDTSVFVERNLGLQNINYPVLNVMYHPKYAKLSELFFGTDTTTYKQEVGFKF